jgi:hypothetical protein
LGEIEELPMATSVIGEQTDLNYVELDTTPYLGVIRLLAALCTVGIIVGGAFPQLQMALLGGFVPVTPAVFKVGLVIILLAVFGLRGTAFVYSKVLRDAFLLMGVIFVSTMSVLITSGYSLADLMQTNFLYYFMPLLACFFTAIPLRVTPRTYAILFLLMFLISLGFSMDQYLTDTKVLPVTSVDGNFNVLAWYMYGSVRAFGLFATPMQFGYFCCFIGAYGVMVALHEGRRVQGLFWLVAAAAGCFFSQTRAAEICFLLTLLVAWAIATKPSKSGLVRLLPLVSILAAILLFVWGLGRLGQGNSYDSASSETFGIRIEEWGYYLQEYVRSSILKQIIGAGLIQFLGSTGRVGNLGNQTLLFMDNTLLAVLMNTGIVGVGVLISLYRSAWKHVLARHSKEASSMLLASISMMAVLPFIGSYDVMLTEMGAFLLVAATIAS